MEEICNYAVLKGSLGGRPQYSHTLRREEFWRFPLEVERLSGAVDRINVIARRSLLENLPLEAGEKLVITGSVRSFHNKSGTGSRLVITLYAKEITFAAGPDSNTVRLVGAISRTPTLRRTPLGREISDMMLSVPRRYGRHDFLPCIAWGRQAEEAALWPPHSRILLTGRLQSRDYLKVLEGGSETRTAYEISAVELKLLKEPG